MDYFIDWLTVYQNHPAGDLPIVSSSVNLKIDPDTGELIKKFTNLKPLSGSYSSTINVRCDGSTVHITGNPSRWNRMDNLFGFKTFDECIRVFNLILADVGLPPLTKNTGLRVLQGRDGSSVTYVPNGAVFTRVDWTINLCVGPGNEKPFIRGFSSQKMGKGIDPVLFPNGQTVKWPATDWLLKLYNKGFEIAKTLKSLIRSKNKSITKEHITYLTRLITFCENHGIVRFEKQFNNGLLRKNNLNLYGIITENDFKKHLTEIENKLERLEMSTSDYSRISEQLLKVGAVQTERQANSTDGVAFQWLHGHPINLKKSQLSVHKRRLKLIGIDISIPFDASKRMPQIKNERVISVKTAVPPHWYHLPEVAMLRAV